MHSAYTSRIRAWLTAAVKFNLDAPEQQLPEGAGEEEDEDEGGEERRAWSAERTTAEQLVAALVEEWAAPM